MVLFHNETSIQLIIRSWNFIDFFKMEACIKKDIANQINKQTSKDTNKSQELLDCYSYIHQTSHLAIHTYAQCTVS